MEASLPLSIILLIWCGFTIFAIVCLLVFIVLILEIFSIKLSAKTRDLLIGFLIAVLGLSCFTWFVLLIIAMYDYSPYTQPLAISVYIGGGFLIQMSIIGHWLLNKLGNAIAQITFTERVREFDKPMKALGWTGGAIAVIGFFWTFITYIRIG